MLCYANMSISFVPEARTVRVMGKVSATLDEKCFAITLASFCQKWERYPSSPLFFFPLGWRLSPFIADSHI